MDNDKIETLFSGIKNGNLKDFEKIFQIYFPKLMYYATQFQNRDDAEDIVQDVFVELWAKRDQLKFGNEIVSFMYLLVHNKSLNRIKHQQVIDGYFALSEIEIKKLDYYSPDENDTFQNLIRKERTSALEIAINELPEKGRKCFELSYVYGIKSKDIANQMDISVRTVEAHIYKSLQILRKKFRNMDFLLLFI